MVPPRVSTCVKREAIGNQAVTYKSVRVRLANIGCTLVRYFYAAHNNGATNHKTLGLLLRRLCRVVVAAENRIDLTHDGPIGRHPHLDSTPHRKDLQYRL